MKLLFNEVCVLDNCRSRVGLFKQGSKARGMFKAKKLRNEGQEGCGRIQKKYGVPYS